MVIDGFTLELKGAGIRGFQQIHAAQQGAFTGTTGTDNGNNFAGCYL